MYASKGPVIEEWADRRFFRPVGWWLANTLAPTPISADGVTLASWIVDVEAQMSLGRGRRDPLWTSGARSHQRNE